MLRKLSFLTDNKFKERWCNLTVEVDLRNYVQKYQATNIKVDVWSFNSLYRHSSAVYENIMIDLRKAKAYMKNSITLFDALP